MPTSRRSSVRARARRRTRRTALKTRCRPPPSPHSNSAGHASASTRCSWMPRSNQNVRSMSDTTIRYTPIRSGPTPPPVPLTVVGLLHRLSSFSCASLRFVRPAIHSSALRCSPRPAPTVSRSHSARFSGHRAARRAAPRTLTLSAAWLMQFGMSYCPCGHF